jgi:methionine salvage enolase-phosphatase E1
VPSEHDAALHVLTFAASQSFWLADVLSEHDAALHVCLAVSQALWSADVPSEHDAALHVCLAVSQALWSADVPSEHDAVLHVCLAVSQALWSADVPSEHAAASVGVPVHESGVSFVSPEHVAVSHAARATQPVHSKFGSVEHTHSAVPT